MAAVLSLAFVLFGGMIFFAVCSLMTFVLRLAAGGKTV